MAHHHQALFRKVIRYFAVHSMLVELFLSPEAQTLLPGYTVKMTFELH